MFHIKIFASNILCQLQPPGILAPCGEKEFMFYLPIRQPHFQNLRHLQVVFHTEHDSTYDP